VPAMASGRWTACALASLVAALGLEVLGWALPQWAKRLSAVWPSVEYLPTVLLSAERLPKVLPWTERLSAPRLSASQPLALLSAPRLSASQSPAPRRPERLRWRSG
jgi:hypothetical protein